MSEPNRKMQIIDKNKWIERHKHESIIRKYQKNIQCIAKDYENKILIQNRRIEILMETIERQKQLISSFVRISGPLERNLVDLDEFETKNPVAIDIDSERSSRSEQSSQDVNSKRRFSGNGAKREIILAMNIQPNVMKFKSPPNCDSCNKMFSSKRSLAKHKRIIHSAVKTFVCTHCNKAFGVGDGLKRHMRIHTGEKPFTCPGCRRDFNQSGNMRIHQKTCRPYNLLSKS